MYNNSAVYVCIASSIFINSLVHFFPENLFVKSVEITFFLGCPFGVYVVTGSYIYIIFIYYGCCGGCCCHFGLMLKKLSFGKMALLGSLAVTALGGGFGYTMYYRRRQINMMMSEGEFNSSQDQPKLQDMINNLHNKKRDIQTKLYRYTTCPWCCTVKAFLDYHRIPHECVEVDPMIKSQIADSKYKKVPQVRFDEAGQPGPYLVDSKVIVDRLAKEYGYAEQMEDKDVQYWREWARSPLVRLVTLEFNKSLIAAWRGYSYIDDCATIPYINKLFLKVVGAPVMYVISSTVVKPRLYKAGVMKPGDVPKERLHEELERFRTAALYDEKKKQAKHFHGGSKPDLVDLDVYGVLQSVRGHRMYNDIMRESKLASWLQEMDHLVGAGEYNLPNI